MKMRSAITLSACLSLASLGVSAQVQVDGDVEAEGDGYVNVGGMVLKTGLGECLQTGTLSDDNVINKCAGIEDDGSDGSGDGSSGSDTMTDGADGGADANAVTAKAPAASVQTAKIDTRQFSEQALFDTNSATLNAAGQTVITAMFSQLSEYKGITDVTVIGHTDSSGDEAYNQALSEQRAQTVADLIKEQYPDLNIDAQGKGESEPVASNDTAEGRQLNRRVEIEITATRMTFE